MIIAFVFLILQLWQLWNFVKNKMLKHDMYCLETASEEDGTPALLRECNENNSNQVLNIIQWNIDFIIWTWPVNNRGLTDIHCHSEKTVVIVFNQARNILVKYM